MGGRRGSSISSILGQGRSASRARSEIQNKLEKAPPEAVAAATIQVVAMAHPAVAALYAAYKVAKFMYPIVKEGVETYEKTGDKDKAVEKMKEETIKQTAKTITSAAISTVVGAGVDQVAQAAGGTVDNTTNTFVKTAVSEAIDEVVT